MNKIDFTETGGFPLDQSTLNFIQDEIILSGQNAVLAGQLAILSGCVVAGLNAGNGFVVINGETLPFVGAAIEDKVIIREEIADLPFQNGDNMPVIKTRYATFGDDGVTNYLWSKFKRNSTEGVLARLERLEWLTAPYLQANGSMVLWRKPVGFPIPLGWQEVEDWRGRLAMGHKPGTEGFEIGDIAGKEGHVMDLTNMIEHDHEQYVSVTDNTGTMIEENHINGGSGRGLWAMLFGRTKKTGQAIPTAIPTVPPVKMVMFIEPIPNYIPNAA